MTIATILALMAALFVLAATPGPAVFAITARALSSGLRSVLAFIVGVTLGDLVLPAVLLGYAALTARARNLFKSPRAMRNLDRGAGTMMIGAGVVVATR